MQSERARGGEHSSRAEERRLAAPDSRQPTANSRATAQLSSTCGGHPGHKHQAASPAPG